MPVSIKWQDSDNADNLRDSKIPFEVTRKDGSKYTFELYQEQDYRKVISVDDIEDIVPTWEK